jgi:hypothetical protein
LSDKRTTIVDQLVLQRIKKLYFGNFKRIVREGKMVWANTLSTLLLPEGDSPLQSNKIVPREGTRKTGAIKSLDSIA